MGGELHVRCGDDLRDTLGPAGFGGDYLRWVDPVCQGPVPDEPDAERFEEIRAAFVAEAYGGPVEEARRQLRAERAALDTLDRYDRITLWFEHDWFDQAILVRLLSELADRPELHERLFLLSIDAFPGVGRFIGLGQLTAEQLGTLAGQDAPVTAERFAAARRAWAALRAPTPVPLQEIAAGDGDDGLPYLGRAVHRHLQELPWTTDGLSLSERLCLQAVAAGATAFADVFHAHQDADPLPYLGDAMLRPVLRRLTEGPRPALAVDGDRYSVTSFGAAILGGEATWPGTARWVGGVALDVPASWRWDPAANRAVSAAPPV